LQDRRDLKLGTKLSRMEDSTNVEFMVCETEYNVSKAANTPGGGPFFEGYASVKNSYDSYNDRIVDGAYTKSLKEKGPREVKGVIRSKIKSLWQHNPDWPFGLPQHAEEDSKGLFQKTRVSATPENMERLTYMEDTVVDGQSIGFMTVDSEWEDEEESDDSEADFFYWPKRILKAVDLWEWSPVTFGAHPEAVTTLVTRNRELMLATKSVDHTALLEHARTIKGITVPAVEEAIATLTTAMTQIKHEESEEEIEEPEENPVENGETSEEDPELVKALEAFAFRSHAAAFAEKTRLATMKTGGR
jgi:HK97 family phage prohead protease